MIVFQRRIRVVHAEYGMESYGRAKVVIRLLDCPERDNGRFNVQQAVNAARDYGHFNQALDYLQQECPICYRLFPADEVSISTFERSLKFV